MVLSCGGYMFDNYVAISEANKNFSNVAKRCDKFGEVIVFKNNKAKYILKSLDAQDSEMTITDEEKIELASIRVLKKYHKAFEELAR